MFCETRDECFLLNKPKLFTYKTMPFQAIFFFFFFNFLVKAENVFVFGH